MKVDKRMLEVESTLQGERVGMTIAPDAMSHIMAILTDLYSDPEMAVLREYSTNALDAHIEAGVNLPIAVTLPTALSPYLKIRDFGNGLDADDIRRIYSQYGASTKRDTDEQVGSLGLGCKSALTYTDQFTLSGIKNGTATEVAISRDEDGAGSMTIVAEYSTDEASGVEIVVPVKAFHRFAQKADELFRFWPEGTVLINGEEPTPLEGGFELDAGIWVYEKNRLSQSYVVMGGVPYPFTPDDAEHYSIVAYVSMGAVSFTPSRESLNMNPKTKATLADIGLRITNAKQTAVQRMIDEAKSKPEALEVSLHAAHLLRYKGEVTYRGKPIPQTLSLVKPGAAISATAAMVVWRTKGARYERTIGEVYTLPTSMFPKSIFVTDFTPLNLSTTHRAKIKKYLADNGLEHLTIADQVVLLRTGLPYASWVDRERVIPFEKIRAVKLDRQANAVRTAGSYERIEDAFIHSTGQLVTKTVPADDLKSEAHLFWEPYIKPYTGYYSYRDSHRQQRERLARSREIVQREYPDAVFITLPQNRVTKFERDLSQAQNVEKAARVIAQNWFDALTPEERAFLSIQKLDSRSGWAMLSARQIHDPNLKALINAAKKDKPGLRDKAAWYGNFFEGEFEEPKVEHYPLLSFPSRYDSTGSRKTKLQRVTFNDARKGSYELDVTDEEGETLGKQGRSTKRRGRKKAAAAA